MKGRPRKLHLCKHSQIILSYIIDKTCSICWNVTLINWCLLLTQLHFRGRAWAWKLCEKLQWTPLCGSRFRKIYFNIHLKLWQSGNTIWGNADSSSVVLTDIQQRNNVWLTTFCHCYMSYKMSRNDFGPTDYLCYKGERKLQIEEVIKILFRFLFHKNDSF